MASKHCLSVLRGVNGTTSTLQVPFSIARNSIRCQSTEASPPPPVLLGTLRNDLKTAMRAKDKNKLNVIKAILNQVTSAAKTQAPINSDMQLLALLRKKIAASQISSKAFQDAGRQDLQEREDAEIAVLDHYAANIKTMDRDEVGIIVATMIDQEKSAGRKLTMGDILPKLIGPGGPLHGQPVEKSLVARLVKEKLP